MRILLSCLLLSGFCWAGGFVLPERSTQCVVGVADDWNSSHVSLKLYEKKDGKWVGVGDEWKGRLGSKGLVWGRGIHPNPRGAVLKKEGDAKSPVGVFNLGGVWGYEKSITKHPKMFYHRVTSRDLWVEDPKSKYYNQFLTLPHEPKTDWEKKAQMVQGQQAHSLKMFIAHNAHPNVVANGGSSIFFHIWRREGAAATSGCTTMDEKKLKWLIAKIDPDKHPIYVLLPRAEYEKQKTVWKLP